MSNTYFVDVMGCDGWMTVCQTPSLQDAHDKAADLLQQYHTFTRVMKWVYANGLWRTEKVNEEAE